MRSWQDFFRGKKITVMGLGLLGRAVGDAKFLAEAGAELIVTDMKSESELARSLELLEQYQNISYALDRHDLKDFRNRDLILKAAGVPLDSPYIAEAKKNGIPVRMSADLFAELSGVSTIGITGTRGKSTVTHMIAHILASAGKKVLLGGNIRGVSTLALLPEATPDAVATLELDSWQLQGWGEAKMSPHIAVFTTFYPDHLNYYHNDLDLYLKDKANIFLYQEPDDVLILGAQCAGLVQEKYEREFSGKFEIWGTADLPKKVQLKIPGEHNRYNAALAYGAAQALGIDTATIERVLGSFEGVEGRLQLVREYNGVKIYNDNNSTTPEATIAALRSIEKPITLITGGSEKNLDLGTFITEIKRSAAKVVVLTHPKYQGSQRLVDALHTANISFQEASNLTQAISLAAPQTPHGSILFSPAFASFGMFNNEYERNDQFLELVRKL